MKARLTERQNQAYEFIRTFMRQHRKPPTLHEIGEGLGIPWPNSIFKLLCTLEQKGYIEREKHAARGIRLVDADDDPFALDDATPPLPVISRTTSHEPHLLHRNPIASFTVDPYFLKDADANACLIGRAGDDGMNPDGIYKGDYLIIEEMPWSKVKNGDLAACLVGERLLARRFYHANGRHHLQPTDRRHYSDQAFALGDDSCYVVGRIIGLMRRLERGREK